MTTYETPTFDPDDESPDDDYNPTADELTSDYATECGAAWDEVPG